MFLYKYCQFRELRHKNIIVKYYDNNIIIYYNDVPKFTLKYNFHPFVCDYLYFQYIVVIGNSFFL